MAKASGYIFTSIDFKDMRMKSSLWNFVKFILSFGISLFATTYNAYLEVEAITHSKLMDIGVNLFTRFALFVGVVIKLLNFIQSRKFHEIISGLAWSHLAVSILRFKASKYFVFLFSASRSRDNFNERGSVDEIICNDYHLQRQFHLRYYRNFHHL